MGTPAEIIQIIRRSASMADLRLPPKKPAKNSVPPKNTELHGATGEGLVNDPDYGVMEKCGEVISRITQLGESLKTLVYQIQAERIMRDRKESRTLRRGPLEIQQRGQVYSAIWNPEPRELEVNGEPRISQPDQFRYSGADSPYGAARGLISALEVKRAWG